MVVNKDNKEKGLYKLAPRLPQQIIRLVQK